MGEMSIQHEMVSRALDTLARILQQIENGEYYTLEQVTDSAIKKFEYSLEMFWKFLKSYLQEVLLIDVKQIYSPRSVFKASVQAAILLPEELKTCINMVEDRNRTAHAYQEVMAEKVFKNIPTHFEFMRSVLERLNSKMKE